MLKEKQGTPPHCHPPKWRSTYTFRTAVVRKYSSPLPSLGAGTSGLVFVCSAGEPKVQPKLEAHCLGGIVLKKGRDQQQQQHGACQNYDTLNWSSGGRDGVLVAGTSSLSPLALSR